MKNYEPTFGIRETSQNVKFFMKAHTETFWNVVKPLLPYIVGLYVMDIVITHLFYTGGETSFYWGGVFATYFYFVLMITWSRVVIQGRDNYVPMNPLSPTKDELLYIFSSLGVTALFFVLGAAYVYMFIDMGFEILYLGLLTIVLLFIFVAYKIGFYFPAKAVGMQMTFAQSWQATRGYVFKMMTVPLLASLRVILAFIVVGLITGVALMASIFALLYLQAPGGDLEAHIGPLLEQGRSPAELLDMTVLMSLNFIAYLPSILYFQPILFAINTTVLANYYMYAMQNGYGRGARS